MTEQSRLRAVIGADSALGRGLRGTAARNAARRQRRLLEREIAAYRTPAERLELDVILGRHTAEEIHEIEEILRHQDAQRSFAERTYPTPGIRV